MFILYPNINILCKKMSTIVSGDKIQILSRELITQNYEIIFSIIFFKMGKTFDELHAFWLRPWNKHTQNPWNKIMKIAQIVIPSSVNAALLHAITNRQWCLIMKKIRTNADVSKYTETKNMLCCIYIYMWFNEKKRERNRWFDFFLLAEL